jgi:proteasome alpha subunit
MQPNDSQQAYDRGTTIFSPDGRLYQVEYAREAVKQGRPAVGVRTADSVILATDSQARSTLLEAESIEKVHDVDGRFGVATAGHVADARRLVDAARQFSQRDRIRYGEAPGVDPMATALADLIQETTQTGGTRPFGSALLLGGVVDSDPSLVGIDPSGTVNDWRATAVGAASDDIREFLAEDWEADIGHLAGRSLALQALSHGIETDLDPDGLGLAVVDDDGFRELDAERRRDALAEAGLNEE